MGKGVKRNFYFDEIEFTDLKYIIKYNIRRADYSLQNFLHNNPVDKLSDIIDECIIKCNEQFVILSEQFTNQLNNDRNKYCNYTDALFEYIISNIEDAEKGANYIIDLINVEIKCSAKVK